MHVGKTKLTIQINTSAVKTNLCQDVVDTMIVVGRQLTTNICNNVAANMLSPDHKMIPVAEVLKSASLMTGKNTSVAMEKFP